MKSNIDGSFKKVGSTCVKDFTGVDPTKFFKAFQHILKTIDELGGYEAFEPGSPRWVDYRVFEVDQIWTISNNVIKLDGEYIKTEWTEVETYRYNWEKVRTNMGEATSDKVKKVIFEYDKEDKYFVNPGEVNDELVNGVREWLTNMVVRKKVVDNYNDSTGKLESVEIDNEFDVKLKEYADRKRVRSFEIGFTGWIVESYLKYLAELDTPKSNWQGEIGDKIQIEAKIISINVFDGGYGSTNVYKMVDKNGNVYTKFGTINPRYVDTDDVEKGSNIKVKGEVKKHNEFRGKKETLIGRISKY